MKLFIFEKKHSFKNKNIKDILIPKNDEIFLVTCFKDMIQLSNKIKFKNIILDSYILETKEFKKLSVFWKLYYLNRFNYILSEEKKIKGCIYPQILSMNNIKEQTYFNKDTPFLRIKENLLILDREDKNFVINNSALFARYNSILFKKYTKLFFLPQTSLKKKLSKNKLHRVFFILPYKNFFKKVLLNKIQSIGMNFYIFERGALPSSFILDNKGFNFDSPYYNKEYWDLEYSNKEKSLALEKMEQIKQGLSLEKQAGEKKTNKIIKEIIKKANGRKIVFVPLQRPWDSVILYFNPMGYKSFIKEILDFSNKFNTDYFVVIKKHPLEKKWPFKGKNINMNNIYLINNNAHINQILNISHVVALINSGVGVLALIFKKRVLFYGKVFYSIKGCNAQFLNALDLKKKIESKEEWASSYSFKFICFLYNRYYSLTKKEHISFSQNWVLNYKKLRLLDHDLNKNQK